MLSYLTKHSQKINFYLNILTLILIPVGVYFTISQPNFYLGKSNLYANQILPIASFLIFFNLSLNFISQPQIKLIPKSKILQALLLFTSTTTIFSIFNYTQNTLWYFSGLALLINLIQTPKKEITYFKKTFWIVSIIISIWAILQFILQTDLNLQFLGEPHISSDIKGISKIKTTQIIRSHASFQHPNILGAFLTLSIYFTPFPNIKNNIPQIIGLISSLSISSFLASIVKLIKTKQQFLIALIGLICLIIFRDLFHNPENITQRFNQYINLIFQTSQLKPWEIQPLHNTFLLSLFKFGPIHLLTMIYLLHTLFSQHKKLVISLSILLFLDHYFLTNFSAYLFLTATIFLIQTDEKTPTKRT